MKFIPSKIVKIAAILVVLIVAGHKCSSLHPNVEIIKQTMDNGFDGLDYVVTLKCTYKNNGADGEVTARGKLSGSVYSIKEKTLQMTSGEVTKVVFKFPEAEFLGKTGAACGFKHAKFRGCDN